MPLRDKQKYREYQKAYKERPDRKEYEKAYYQANKEKVKRAGRVRRLLSDHGLRPGQVDLMWFIQGGVCAICLEAIEREGTRGTHIDHDHETGRIRGLLCMRCNWVLGFFREDPQIFLRAIQYLKDDGVIGVETINRSRQTPRTPLGGRKYKSGSL